MSANGFSQYFVVAQHVGLGVRLGRLVLSQAERRAEPPLRLTLEIDQRSRSPEAKAWRLPIRAVGDLDGNGETTR